MNLYNSKTDYLGSLLVKVKDPHSGTVPSGLAERIDSFIIVGLEGIEAASRLHWHIIKFTSSLLLSNMEHYEVTQGEGFPWLRLKALSLSTKFI
jgi:hypothetical protein